MYKLKPSLLTMPVVIDVLKTRAKCEECGSRLHRVIREYNAFPDEPDGVILKRYLVCYICGDEREVRMPKIHQENLSSIEYRSKHFAGVLHLSAF